MNGKGLEQAYQRGCEISVLWDFQICVDKALLKVIYL